MNEYHKCKVPTYSLLQIPTIKQNTECSKTFLEEGVLLKVWHSGYFNEYNEKICFDKNSIINFLNTIATIWELAEWKYWKYNCYFKLYAQNLQFIFMITVIHNIYYLEGEKTELYIVEMNKKNKKTTKYKYNYDCEIENKYIPFLILNKIINNIQNNKCIFIIHNDTLVHDTEKLQVYF